MIQENQKIRSLSKHTAKYTAKFTAKFTVRMAVGFAVGLLIATSGAPNASAMSKIRQKFSGSSDVKISEFSQEDSKSIKIMSYNVHNFFDAEGDTDSHGNVKYDHEFLPEGHPKKKTGCRNQRDDNRLKCNRISDPVGREKCIVKEDRYYVSCLKKDWTQEKVTLKLNQFESALRDAGDALPDVLALQEIENENVVQMIATRLGYTSFGVTESPDIRGIDVAILVKENSNLRLVQTNEYPITGPNFTDHPTRNILEAQLSVGGHTVFTYVVHWPSQGAPAPVRVDVAKQMMTVIGNRLTRNPNVEIIVMGDFNTIPQDFPHPFHAVLMSGDYGNGLALTDVHEAFMKDFSVPYGIKRGIPLGSYFYATDMTWNKLDHFFVSPNLMDKTGLEVDIPTYRIYAPDHLKSEYTYTRYKNEPFYGSTIKGVPYRYTHFGSGSTTKPGYSDHFPIIVNLKY